MIDKELLSILACPACQSDLVQRAEQLVCQNADCGLKYPVRNGIPVLLVDEASR